MFYWFQRGDELLRYEARQISPTHFEFSVIGADGLERVERFATSEELTARQIAFEQQLTSDGWAGPHGWNL